MCGRYTERENGEIRHRITTATFADHTEHLLELSNCTAPTVSAKTARFPISCPLAAFGGGGEGASGSSKVVDLPQQQLHQSNR